MADSLEWVKGYTELSRQDGPLTHSQVARYSLRELSERGLLNATDVNRVLLDSGLHDFCWYMVWGEDYANPDDELATRFNEVDGYVVFIHGWTGSHAIWEDLPAMITVKHRRLVALIVDHNGFGDTSFSVQTPDFEHCSPIGAMRAIERWFDLIGLRRQPGNRKPKTVNFVGHSMGGAALFFLDTPKWHYAEQTRTALAPALLLHDDLHRAFYTTLGLGIGLVARLPFLESIEELVSPRILELLTDGATSAVTEEHRRVYAATPRSVTARTFAAMGIIREHPHTPSWEYMRVVLAHRDLLVGLIPMMNLLQELKFRVDQVRVVMGTHYMFSVGDDMQTVHEQNRSLVIQDVLSLHEEALKRQKLG